MSSRIEDYALIGDCEAAALVGRNGSIDWLCWPRFDSDACFAALLGTEEHGCWSIAPPKLARTTRRYRDDTLVLDTTFSTEQGVVRLTDFMPIRGGTPVLVRSLTGISGTVCVRSALNLQFDYGSMPPWITLDGATAVARVGPDLAVLRAPADLHQTDGKLVAEIE